MSSKIKIWTRKAARGLNKHAPIILTVSSVVGLSATSYFVYSGTLKASKIIEKEKQRLDVDKIPAKETLKLVWKNYIPAVGFFAATTACIIGSQTINMNRNAALASMYAATDLAFKEYKNKTKEVLGKNKELNIRDQVCGDKVQENPPTQENVTVTGKGDVLFFDPHTARYFRSDIESIRRSINDLNADLLRNEFISQNDLYYAIGLKEVKDGELVGWYAENGLIDIRFSSTLTDNNEPCAVLEFEFHPKFD